MAGFNATFQEEKKFGASLKEQNNMTASFGNVQVVETGNYNALINKPSIESVELIGNKTFKQLGMEAATVQEVEAILYLG